jgi:hypothetical protein
MPQRSLYIIRFASSCAAVDILISRPALSRAPCTAPPSLKPSPWAPRWFWPLTLQKVRASYADSWTRNPQLAGRGVHESTSILSNFSRKRHV